MACPSIIWLVSTSRWQTRLCSLTLIRRTWTSTALSHLITSSSRSEMRRTGLLFANFSIFTSRVFYHLRSFSNFTTKNSNRSSSRRSRTRWTSSFPRGTSTEGIWACCWRLGTIQRTLPSKKWLTQATIRSMKPSQFQPARWKWPIQYTIKTSTMFIWA